MDPKAPANQSFRGSNVPPANQNKPPPGTPAPQQPQQPPPKPTPAEIHARKKAEAQKPPVPPTSAAANPRRQSAAATPILPPDRRTEALNEKRRPSQWHVRVPSTLSLPEKSRRASSAKQPKLSLSYAGSAYSTASSMGGSTYGGAERMDGKTPSGSGRSVGAMVFKKPDKGQVSEYQANLRTIDKFAKSDGSNAFFGSMSSRASTQPASIESIPPAMTAEVMAALRSGATEIPNGAPVRSTSVLDAWSLCWSVVKSGRALGQIRLVRDVCVLRNGQIAVAEAKNSRVQIFQNTHAAPGWRSIACLGESSENEHTAQSFRNPTMIGANLIYRKMEPTGLCEMPAEDNVLAVTDLNRLLYVDATGHGGLQTQVLIKGTQQLHGVAATQAGRLIMCEIGTQPSVGLYENTGRIVREFRGELKRPAYVAWDDDYQIAAVSDGELHCVCLYDANGRFINRFGNQPPKDGSDPSATLDYPSGVCWLPKGRLLVADRAGHRVVMFDLKNMSVETVLKDGLSHPVALATNGRNRIVLSEEYYDFGVAQFRLKMFKFLSGSASAMMNQDAF